MTMGQILLENTRIFDGVSEDCAEGPSVLIDMGIGLDAAGLAVLHEDVSHADPIVVDGDPLADIGLLGAGGRNLDLIMRAGKVIKSRLN